MRWVTIAFMGMALLGAAVAGDEATAKKDSEPRCFGWKATIVLQPGKPRQGTPGNDVIVGTAGDDFILSNGGTDRICGGADDDLLRSFDPRRVFIDGGAGEDNIQGFTGNDVIRGGDGNDVLHGVKGNDAVAGGDGNDKLNGQEGDDRLVGGRGADALEGDAGTGELAGGPDDDTCRQDVFPDPAVSC